MPTALWVCRILPSYAELETIWKSAVTNVLSGAKDVDTAVNDAAAEMQSSLDS